jgi:phosphohistidine phosphatase
VRHADAVAKGDNGAAKDFERHLSEQGREQAARLAEALAALGVRLDAVVSSPLIRARETAEPLLPLLITPSHEPIESEYLAIGGLRPKRLSRFVGEHGGETVALVGHNPDLSAYAGWLLGAEETAIDLDKGAAALIAFPDGIEKGEGRLEWCITPAWYLGALHSVGA